MTVDDAAVPTVQIHDAGKSDCAFYAAFCFVSPSSETGEEDTQQKAAVARISFETARLKDTPVHDERP